MITESVVFEVKNKSEETSRRTRFRLKILDSAKVEIEFPDKVGSGDSVYIDDPEQALLLFDAAKEALEDAVSNSISHSQIASDEKRASELVALADAIKNKTD